MSVLSHVLHRKMDRKEFLVYVGLILLAVTGISGLLKNLKNINDPKPQKGFGSGTYGS